MSLVQADVHRRKTRSTLILHTLPYVRAEVVCCKCNRVQCVAAVILVCLYSITEYANQDVGVTQGPVAQVRVLHNNVRLPIVDVAYKPVWQPSFGCSFRMVPEFLGVSI